MARSEGISHELIAQTHRISVSSVYKYLSEFESKNKIKHEERGGTESKLDKEQTRKLIQHLQEVTYFQS